MTINATDSPTGRTWKIELSEKEMFDVMASGIGFALLLGGIPKEAISMIVSRTMRDKEIAEKAYEKLDSFTREALREFHRLGTDPNLNIMEFLTP